MYICFCDRLRVVCVAAVGLTAAKQQAQGHDDNDELLDLAELTLRSEEHAEPCSIPGYGPFGTLTAVQVQHGHPDTAAAAATLGGYGGYGPTPGQYGAYGLPAAGVYGLSNTPGGYGTAAAAAAAAAGGDQHCSPLKTPGRLMAVGGLANCKVG